MPKKAVSVTLERDNLTWLRARQRAMGRKSLSDMLDQVVAEARERANASPGSKRSVVGTIAIAPDDPDLTGADAAIRALFAANLRKPEGPVGGADRARGVRAKASRG